jgi:hypothetical protein
MSNSDPRLAALAARLEDQVAQADELVSAFRQRALGALNDTGGLPLNHIARAGLLDSASRLASTVARLMQASATAADTIQRLRGGGAVQRIVVERAVFMAGDQRGGARP